MNLAERIVKGVLGDHPNAEIRISLPTGTIPISPRDLTDLVQTAIDAQPKPLRSHTQVTAENLLNLVMGANETALRIYTKHDGPEGGRHVDRDVFEGLLDSAIANLSASPTVADGPDLADKILVSLMGENKHMSVPLDRDEVLRRITTAILTHRMLTGMQKVEAKVLSQNADDPKKFDVAAGSATIVDDPAVDVAGSLAEQIANAVMGHSSEEWVEIRRSALLEKIQETLANRTTDRGVASDRLHAAVEICEQLADVARYLATSDESETS